jgi:hypothetical protein
LLTLSIVGMLWNSTSTFRPVLMREGSLLAGESVGVGDFLEGAGPWVAEAVNVTAGGAVRQRTAGSCVAACGEMLSGGAMSQAEFLAHLGEWSNPGALAEALNALEGVTTWEGGYCASAADAVVAVEWITKYVAGGVW